MDYNLGIYGIGGIGIVVILLGLIKNRTEWILNFIIRFIIGIISITIFNKISIYLGYEVIIGINIISSLTSATLGIPGVLGLYLLKIYTML